MSRPETSPSARRGGFTLLEVLLVMAILVILGSTATYFFVGVKRNADSDAARLQINMFESMLDNYNLHVSAYPSTNAGLEALRTRPSDLKDPNRWKGPYINKEIPLDPWGNPYEYEMRGEMPDGSPAFLITSYGPDGIEGGPDDITSDQ
ncbi:type II secretion system major pseudopilin GspG [Lignipirellula cremea]|nr:type II secretion system major pseudopilin GspG [Lignipirellula cremea]